LEKVETVLSQPNINGTCGQREVYLSSKFAINGFQRTSRVSMDEHKRGIQCNFKFGKNSKFLTALLNLAEWVLCRYLVGTAKKKKMAR